MSLDYGYGDHEERELAEREDDHAERARELLHASAIRFCPTCDTTVLTRRRGKSCLWCDGPTLPQTEPGLVTTRASRPCGSLADGAGACGFCKGQPVGNAAAWVDGGPRRSAACPRCGVRTPYPEEKDAA